MMIDISSYLTLSSFHRSFSTPKIKWKPVACSKKRKIPLVALGDAKWGKRRWRGSLPGLSGVLRRKLQEAERQGRLVVVNIDEYLTSQVSVPFSSSL